MRYRLAVPLALLISLLAASPAAAAFDWKVDVREDFTFSPKERRISLGDSVTWTFSAAGHSSASLRGQPDSWRSVDTETSNPQGSTYTHTFNTPGRYQYVCLQHKDFMKGVIEAGTDTVADSLDNFKSKRTGNRVKLSFTLNEPATVRYKLTGPSRRTVNRGRLGTGRHSFTLRRLRRGTYRGVMTVVDDFDHKSTPRNFFVIR